MTTTLPTPRYAIGATVYLARVTTERADETCPDCLGKRIWHAVLPSGEELDFECPTCTRGYAAMGTVETWVTGGTVEELTIGSVQIDTNHDHPVQYMCKETGIGSGAVWRESLLHADRAAAEALLPQMIEAENWRRIESRATDRKRRIADGPGRMAAHYRAKIREARKEIEQCERGLARQAAKDANP